MTLREADVERIVEGLSALRVVEREALRREVRRAVGAKPVPPDELPYKVDERKFSPFSVRNTIFGRAKWDPEIARLRAKMAESRKRNMAKGVRGFTFADFGLEVASRLFCGAHRRGGAGGHGGPEATAPRRLDVGPELLTRLVKRAALFFGADMVGVAKVDRKWLYRESAPRLGRFPVAVVMAFEMDATPMGTANEGPYAAEVGWGYSRMSITAASLALFLRWLGFEAEPMGNEGALSVPLAIMAGLGEAGRMGLLITPEFGPRVRLAKVFTDAPLVPDKPIKFGVWEFCRTCNLCVKACLGGAIPRGEPTWDGPTISEQRGVLKWHVNHEKCYAVWAGIGRGCGLCIKACPFGKNVWGPQRLAALREAVGASKDRPS